MNRFKLCLVLAIITSSSLIWSQSLIENKTLSNAEYNNITKSIKDLDSLYVENDSKDSNNVNLESIVANNSSFKCIGDGSSISNLDLNYGDKLVSGHSICHSFLIESKNSSLVKERLHKNYFNIFILTDYSNPKETGNHYLSRNESDCFVKGMQNTSIGSVSYLQKTLSDRLNFVIINERYFDLNEGKTILVAPQKDGSFKFLQLKESHGDIVQKFDSQAKWSSEMKKFELRLSNIQVVETFFTNKNVLTSK